MTRQLHVDDAPRKILGRTRLKLQIGAGCLAVLALGSWSSPAPTPTASPLAVSEERAAPLLEEQSHVRTASGLARLLDDTVRATRDFGVRFPPPVTAPTRPSLVTDVENATVFQSRAFGVRVSDTRILTHVDALPAAVTLQGWGADGARIDGTVAAFEPSTGLVLLAVGAAGSRPVPATTEEPRPGALVVGVGPSERGDVVAPVFVTSVDRGRIGLSGGPLPAGLPLYDLEGRLIAVAAGGDAAEAFAVAPAMARLDASPDSARRLSFGIALQSRSDDLLRAYGPKGVVVGDVVVDGPADRAGIAPGDLLLEVGGAQVDDPSAAIKGMQAASAGATTVPFRIRPYGARQTRSVDVTPVPTAVVAVLARRRRPESRPPEAGVIFSPAALAAAGVSTSARVLAIDGTPVGSPGEAATALRRRRTPVAAVLADDRGRFVAAIEVSR